MIAKRTALCTLAGCLAIFTTVDTIDIDARNAVPPPADDNVQLTGCLVRAEDDKGYLLTNGPGDPVLEEGSRRVEPGTAGTTIAATTMFYWLDGDKALESHVGHRVEVKGELKGDISEGEIKLDRKDRWTELTVSADGRKMKAHIPNSSIVPGADQKGRVMVKRVDVEHVKMLGADCQ